MYYNDFDDNGKKEQVLTYYLGGKEIEFANKGELEKAEILSADYFSNAILFNDGKLNFSVQAMPWQAQLSTYKDAVMIDANGDDLPDILLVGNYYENNIQMGRYDADFGTILINRGNGKFECVALNGLVIKGQVRHIQKINIGKKEAFILVRNNDSTMVIQFKDEGRNFKNSY
jgi:hypothetical protein